MVMLIVLIMGGIAFSRIPIDLMPEITYPTLTVVTDYENAGPEEMEDLVTRPIEQAVSAVPGVQEVTSESSDRISSVRISFIWGTNLDEAANDIRDRLDRIIGNLPDGAGRPTLRKFDLSQFPILIFGVTSNLDPIEVRRIVEEQISYRLERIPGVAAVNIWGGQEREIQVRVFADKVKALGLPINQVINAIKLQNVSIPTGTLVKGNYDLMVSTAGAFTSLDELRDTVVAVRNGVPIQLKEIADVEAANKKNYQIIRINGRPGIRISIQKQSLANTVEVAKGALTELESIQRDIPQLSIFPLVNTADYIERSISNVARAAGYGGIFAIVIFLVFLRSFRTTAIISTAIPVSIIGTFVFIYFSGFTINLMTLGALAIGVGMIVDNSIVVLENIFRIRKTGIDSRVAAINGSEEVTSAIIASTLTTLVIFLPLIFIRGMAGIMFKQLAYVISFALLCSLAVALTLIPMLISRIPNKPLRFFERNGSVRKSSSEILTETTLDPITDTYRKLLSAALAYKKTTVLITGLMLAASLALIPFVGVEYMPESDEGEVRVNVDMDVGTSLEILDKKFELVERIIRDEVPELRNMVAHLGSSGWRAGGSHSGRMQVTLKPLSERSRSSQEIANDLRRKLAGIPGVDIRTRAGQGLFIFRVVSGGGSERIQIDIRGFDIDRANLLALDIKSRIEAVEGVTDVRLSLEAGRPEEQIRVDRSRAADLQLSVTDIAENLQTVLSGTTAGVYREKGKEYDIQVKIKDAEYMALN
jgi:HAE1 family hydrophobic/amphiphilic exporter-1